jgi:hypothetical protein
MDYCPDRTRERGVKSMFGSITPRRPGSGPVRRDCTAGDPAAIDRENRDRIDAAVDRGNPSRQPIEATHRGKQLEATHRGKQLEATQGRFPVDLRSLGLPSIRGEHRSGVAIVEAPR